jgi:cyclopropane fatty-acyl-phospholipid synthase-like methyltransferase
MKDYLNCQARYKKVGSHLTTTILSNKPKTILDVGGNTGRFALRCVDFNDKVTVTIMDLPQQLELMKEQINGKPGAERINGYANDLLDPKKPFPTDFDAIWMSQFLDCFSNNEVISILQRASKAMDKNTKLYIMETVWDRQRFETASYCLTQISVYFTAMANGNSKMFYSKDLENCISEAGLEIEEIHDELGMGYSLYVCKKR